ncbi:MAG: cytochrome P450 [Gammaproteobacteria bacterium]|jgi:cytochrome P450|nr:cytochrome P450 [Gammaproteobacteria bacterium]MBT3866983.1 cytochrome P450 [Gammaproteobacteria bacterium]MBT4380302.1 cytochrome P450 [Gammaproteobacteria bacterium]MBT4618914.1 cytochrome P450 [Gammaproteobacteria bacterium]MBT5199280.1 cytochrome P450 [Gammaproteobacteria bacterium]
MSSGLSSSWTSDDYKQVDLDRARDYAKSADLTGLDVSNFNLFQADAIWPFFERLRKDSPVHYHADSRYGPYWSITKHSHLKEIDSDNQRFSSTRSITIQDPLGVASDTERGSENDIDTSSFIAMDAPKHDQQRRVVSPVVAPPNLAKMEDLIRSRVIEILEGLPVDEEFNWVDRVSIELTTQMLATLFDFPFEERRKLTFWSDVATGGPRSGLVNSWDEAREALNDCLASFQTLWADRSNEAHEGFDLVTMLAQNSETKDMPPQQFLSTLLLLIIGGNDTTRNSISGGVLALNQFPDQYEKLRANAKLIPNMVAEIIRWQTPLAHMRRTALEDVEFHGKTIRKGDKVVMWYISGNRDEEVFENADKLIIDRKNARQHVSFGFGLHRCMGNRLAEMQLRVLWEEIQKRFHKVEVTGAPKRTPSNFVKGYTHLPVRLHRL